MSLQIWLPLNGNLTNQGINSSAFTSSATYDNNGKIGKCLSSNIILSVQDNLISKITLKNQYSFALWMKSKNSSGWVFRFGDINGNTPSNSRGMWININANYEFAYQNSGTAIGSASTICDNNWHHIVYTVDDKSALIYVDGKLVQNLTLSYNQQLNYEYIQLNGNTNYINDFRIYDHCLSLKEVKELAKGLVLHYRLAGPGQENLIKNSQLATSWGTGDVCTCNNPTGYSFDGECIKITSGTAGNQNNGYGIFLSTSDISYSVGEKLTFSVDIKGRGEHIALWFLGADGNWWTGANFHTYFTQYDDWTRLSVTGTVPSGTPGMMLGLHVGLSNNTLYAKNMKLERGGVQTPWTPHPSDTTWTTMGYSNNIEYDCSGYKHNGTPVSTTTRPSWDADSPRYTTSFNYSGKTSQANYTTSTDMNFTDNFSWAIWIKPNYTAGSAQYVFTGGRADAGGYGYGLQVASATSCTIFYGNNGRYAVGAKSGEWHHVAFTKTGTTCKCYLDGKLISTNTFGGTNPTYSDGNGVGIGCFHYTGDIYPYFGKASDLRIYATCLSDDDIAELYHSAVIIDNTGKTYAYEYFEG